MDWIWFSIVVLFLLVLLNFYLTIVSSLAVLKVCKRWLKQQRVNPYQ